MPSDPPRIHMHYVNESLGHGGAPRNYADTWAFLSGSAALKVIGHNMFDTSDISAFAKNSKGFTSCDTVLCNAGPYAHFYHYFREQSGSHFRIVRDVRTAFWAPYLMQESLCQPLLRPNDILIVPSDYAAAAYVHMFPHLRHHDIRVAYPLNYGFAASEVRRAHHPNGRCRVGYLGRLSADKSFPALASFLNRLDDAKFDVVVAGPLYPYSRSCSKALRRLLRNRPSAKYLGVVGKSQLASFFSQIDLLLFPSTSSNETFGRVHAEACRAGVKVIAADFGPMSSAHSETILIPTQLTTFSDRPLYSPFSFGWVDEKAFYDALSTESLATLTPYEDLRYAPDAMIHLLACASRAFRYDGSISPPTRRFLERVSIRGLAPDSKKSTLHLVAAMLRGLEQLSAGLPNRLRYLLPLLTYPRDQLLSRVLYERALGTANIGVLRTSLALCATVGFNPEMTFANSTIL